MALWSILTFAATAVAWLTAAIVFRAGKGESARRLALLLFIDGTAVITTESGIMQWVTDAGVATKISLLHAASDIAIAVSAIGIAMIVGFPRLFVGEAIPNATYVRWVFSWATWWSVVGVGVVVVLGIGIAASYSAWRGAETELLKRRAKVFMWAFGTRDAVWASIYLLAVFFANSLTTLHLVILLQIYAASLLVYSALVGYGILTTQLFDIDIKLRWSIRQGTVAAAFVAVYFLVSELATTVLSNQLGTVVGLLASAFLIFVLAPLHRLAERFAEKALPNVRNSPEYAAYRKLQVYASACEAAYQDGLLSTRERKVLDTLIDSLGIYPEDAAQVEADFKGRPLERRV